MAKTPLVYSIQALYHCDHNARYFIDHCPIIFASVPDIEKYSDLYKIVKPSLLYYRKRARQPAEQLQHLYVGPSIVYIKSAITEAKQ